MGKSTKPLKIVVDPSLYTAPWVDELRAKGHFVCPAEWADDIDLILAPQACRWLPGMEFVLDDVIKGARKVRYPEKKEARAATVSRGETHHG